MASRSRDVLDVQASAPSVTDEVLLIPVRDIELGERLRPIDPVWAEALGRILQAEGQRTPIEVCRLPGKSTYTVVSGGHHHADHQRKPHREDRHRGDRRPPALLRPALLHDARRPHRGRRR